MKIFFKANIFVCLFLFFFSGCIKKEIIVKYKTYKFNEYIKLERVLFQPFKSNVSFKSKIILTLSNGKKYKFYAIVYNKNNTHRIFAYTFFGRKIIDILFHRQSYIVFGNKQELYIVVKNLKDENNSLFYFFKEILDGIVVDKAVFKNNCIYGIYKKFNVITCEKDNYKKVNFFKNNELVRSFEIDRDHNGFPEKITLYSNKNKLEIIFKDFVKEKNFKEEFFNYVKLFKVFYIKNMTDVEKNIFK